jgi:pyruvate,water dikinase
MEEVYIKQFKDICINDVPAVGGKNASLGEMFSKLSAKGIPVPDGFATTAFSFTTFLHYNHLQEPIAVLLRKLDRQQYSNLRETGAALRKLMLSAEMPIDISLAITQAYRQLGPDAIAVAVRSSATAEDLPEASFAGQHESYLNVSGADAVLQAVKKCYASLYTDRAIKYREDNHFEHDKVALSVGIQKMVRSDKSSSGVAFTLEPESGFRNLVHISGVWGLGENIVQGTVTPDEFLVFKPTLAQGKNAIIQKNLGEKALTMVYGNDAEHPVINIETPDKLRRQFVLSDDEITTIARWCIIIEDHYQKPMDIEWARDGVTNQLFIIQARPETVHSRANPMIVKEYHIREKGETITQGEAIGAKISIARARVIHSPEQSGQLQPGEIVVTELTSPDWDPILKNASGIITDKGGRTSHASIVARELGVPAIVGCGNATTTIKDGEWITISCAEGKTGFVYRGKSSFSEESIDFTGIKKPERTEVMLIVADPEQAFNLSFYPNDGVGLLRMEFIITHAVQVHPMALVNFEKVTDPKVRDKINALTINYADKKKYFVDKLAEGVATIAAAFYPKQVIVRMSDFKTNEYANLIGGKDFEPHEENPMLGFRGASRYYHELYRDGFRLECEAIRKVRDEMGLTNVKVMIPFCRTIEEGNKVIGVMKTSGLEQGVNGLEIYVMAEIPSNVILAEKFASIFDGFSIGSNDLTQLTLGIDRDSSTISDLFDEQNEAAMEMVAQMIKRAHIAGVKIGLCGQAPSDYPQFAQFLVRQGIDSISFNADALMKGIENILKAEESLQKKVMA